MTTILMCHQVLVKHFLVADLSINLIVQLELDPVESHHLMAIISVVVKPVNFLIDHLHDLVLVKSV